MRITGRLGALRRDPDHNDVLETAIAARASFLVTWNVRDYEELGRDADGRPRYRGVEVVEPGEMCGRFGRRCFEVVGQRCIVTTISGCGTDGLSLSSRHVALKPSVLWCKFDVILPDAPELSSW